MERWLSKPRVVFALCVVLFVGAFNRADPMVYGLFLFLATVGLLGWGLPWLSLRSTVFQRAGRWPTELDLVEGQPVDLGCVLRQGAWWPAWVVEVEARWEWASRQFVSRSTVPVLRRGKPARVLDAIEFGCRGRYVLREIRIRSGFPLGLIHSERVLRVDDCVALVRPAADVVLLPGDWTVSADPAGDATTRHLGDSLELNMLRPYQPGTPVGRVDWRASARAGDLIVRHYQESASVFVRLVVSVPGADEIARPQSPGEHAVRAGAAVCAQLAAERIRYALTISGEPAALTEVGEALRALSAAPPAAMNLLTVLARACKGMARGEQLVAVVAATQAVAALLPAARDASAAGGRLVVVIATWQEMPADLRLAAGALRADLHRAGILGWLAWP